MFRHDIFLTFISNLNPTSLFGSSCATIPGGRVSTAQRTKPVAGEPARKIRVVALIADFCFGIVPVVVDFATGAVYRPENK